MSNEINTLVGFDKFLIDTDKKVLWFDEEPVELPLKSVELLCVLIENQGEIVTKDELLDQIWKDSFVEESVLSQNVYRLRTVFKKHGAKENLIQTIPRRGYRFAGEVSEIIEETEAVMILERHTLEHQNSLEEDNVPKRSFLNDNPKVSRDFKRNILIGGIALLLAFVLIAGYIWQSYSTKVDDNIKSLAVLPLNYISENEDDKSLSLGLADNLITSLGSLNHFTVRPLSAVVKFDKSGKDAVKFGEDIQVDAVLTGTIQQVDNQLRVNLRLIRVKNGSQIWEESFEETKTDIFKLQDALSSEVAKSLISHLTKSEEQKLVSKLTKDTDAYEAYQKGRYFWSKRTKKGLEKAIIYFQKALEIDPNFAEAYVSLADSQYLLFDYRWDNSKEKPQRAKENLLKALSIKPTLASALSTLGMIQATVDWDWKQAEDSFQRALKLEPNSSQVLHRYGVLKIRLREFSEAQELLAKARKLDPLSVAINMNHGVSFLYDGKLETAENQLKDTLEIAPKFSPARWYLARCYWQQNRKDEAVEEIIKALDNSDNKELATKMRQSNGDAKDKIRILYEHWQEDFKEQIKDGHDLAFASSFLQDKDVTLSWLENSVKNHDTWAAWIYSEPEFDFVRNEPRFVKLMQIMKFNK